MPRAPTDHASPGNLSVNARSGTALETAGARLCSLAHVELSISEQVTTSGSHILRLTGALDLASRDELTRAGNAALQRAETKSLVLDLAELDFLDSSGIGAIVLLAGSAEDAEREFALQAPSERVVRVLGVSGLLDTWPIRAASD